MVELEGCKVKVKIKLLKKGAQVPEYHTDGAAAVDISACIDRPIIIEPMGRAAIPTGIAVELPKGYELQLRARSGLSIKQGLGLVNGVATIDSDFRGEIQVLAINWGNEAVEVTNGMRIAQGVVARYEHVVWEASKELGESQRGTKGFGSTGTH